MGSAIVLMVAALGTAAYGGFLFDLFWFLAATGILWEWLRLVGSSNRMLLFVVGASVLAGAAALTALGAAVDAVGVLMTGGMVIAGASDTGSRSLSGLGLVYAGALIVSVTVLRQSAVLGREAILFLFAVVWGTDCMAFFGGRLIGGPKLARRLSPSKTWSGFTVGIVSGAALGWAVSPAIGCAICTLALGLACGAVAQAGDVAESMIKRRFKVKDSGHIIPGHGGLMDRLDGFVAASIFAACLGVWRSGIDSAGAGLF